MSPEATQAAETVELNTDSQSFEQQAGEQALAELNALMAESGHVKVESPRLTGVLLPLAALINACPEPPTAENANKFLVEAHALLNSAKPEQPEEEKGEDNESEEEPEARQAKKKLN